MRQSSLIPMDGQNRANRSGMGCCPLEHCKKPDIFFEDLIPNLALRKACDWFHRQ
jgi:hypothetical protein